MRGFTVIIFGYVLISIGRIFDKYILVHTIFVATWAPKNRAQNFNIHPFSLCLMTIKFRVREQQAQGTLSWTVIGQVSDERQP